MNPDMSRKAARFFMETKVGRELGPMKRAELAREVSAAEIVEDLPREWRRWWYEANRQLGIKPQ